MLLAPGKSVVLQDEDELEHLEIELLLEAVFRRHGFDFRDYAYTSLRRRILHVMHSENLSSISRLQDQVLHSSGTLERLLNGLTISVTSMFRDPEFYRAIREKVLPILRTYPSINIWHAGCASGEEVYSMAILMHEEGLYDKCRLYATDMNEMALKSAKSGILPLTVMKEYTSNYIRSGGKSSFSEYYTAKHGNALFDPSLKKNVVFAHHNLVTDSSFHEFHFILCRNVMIYFNHGLQTRVFNLFNQSLSPFGLLALGIRESLMLNPLKETYEEIDGHHRLFRRIS